MTKSDPRWSEIHPESSPKVVKSDRNVVRFCLPGRQIRPHFSPPGGAKLSPKLEFWGPGARKPRVLGSRSPKTGLRPAKCPLWHVLPSPRENMVLASQNDDSGVRTAIWGFGVRFSRKRGEKRHFSGEKCPKTCSKSESRNLRNPSCGPAPQSSQSYFFVHFFEEKSRKTGSGQRNP